MNNPCRQICYYILGFVFLLHSCSPPIKYEMCDKMVGRMVYLNIAETRRYTNITFPESTLEFKQNKTFVIHSKSKDLDGLSGKWDLCCYISDYGDIIFKLEGLPDWSSSYPSFFVLIRGKKIRLSFTYYK